MDSWKKKGVDHHQDHKFAELIFSWSIDDILNEELYKYQAEKIPLTFQSEEHYFSSFVYPFLEETRTELASALEIMHSAPFSEIISLNEVKDMLRIHRFLAGFSRIDLDQTSIMIIIIIQD